MENVRNTVNCYLSKCYLKMHLLAFIFMNQHDFVRLNGVFGFLQLFLNLKDKNGFIELSLVYKKID